MRVWIFDTEATSTEEDREPIEIAYLDIEMGDDLAGEHDRIEPQSIVDAKGFCERFRPDGPITFGSMAVHHIVPGELINCRRSSEFVVPDDVGYMVGHNIDFDWEAVGRPAHVRRIDTDCMSRWTWHDADSYSQSALLYMTLGATAQTREFVRDAHSAAVDVGNNARLLMRILDEHPDIQTWSQLHAYSEKCRIPRTCHFRQFRGIPWADVASDDPGFCDWVLRQDWVDDYTRTAVEQALSGRWC